MYYYATVAAAHDLPQSLRFPVLVVAFGRGINR